MNNLAGRVEDADKRSLFEFAEGSGYILPEYLLENCEKVNLCHNKLSYPLGHALCWDPVYNLNSGMTQELHNRAGLTTETFLSQ
jgi:hypothetical protein